MILIQLTDDHVDMLLKCKNTKKRSFSKWGIHSLLNEAIFEFYNRYNGGDEP